MVEEPVERFAAIVEGSAGLEGQTISPACGLGPSSSNERFVTSSWAPVDPRRPSRGSGGGRWMRTGHGATTAKKPRCPTAPLEDCRRLRGRGFLALGLSSGATTANVRGRSARWGLRGVQAPGTRCRTAESNPPAQPALLSRWPASGGRIATSGRRGASRYRSTKGVNGNGLTTGNVAREDTDAEPAPTFCGSRTHSQRCILKAVTRNDCWTPCCWPC